jgi:hypothetical protein
VPAPQSHTSNVCAGASAPCSEQFVSDTGSRQINGGQVTVILTGIVRGLLSAAGSLIVIVAEYVPQVRPSVS